MRLLAGRCIPFSKLAGSQPLWRFVSLSGEKPRDIRPAAIKYANPKFDWREMQRWGISESNLPPGSEVLFREPGIWEKYQLAAVR